MSPGERVQRRMKASRDAIELIDAQGYTCYNRCWKPVPKPSNGLWQWVGAFICGLILSIPFLYYTFVKG